MAIDPLSFAMPVRSIKETLDRPEGKGGGVGFGASSGGGLPGAAERFAGALREAMKVGGEDALDLTAQATLGSQFMALMNGEDPTKLAELSELNMMLDSLAGAKAGTGGGLDLMGLMGGAIPGGLKGTDLTRVAEALKGNAVLGQSANAGGMIGGGSLTDIIDGLRRVGGPERTDGPQRIGGTPEAFARRIADGMRQTGAGAAQNVAQGMQPHPVASAAAPKPEQVVTAAEPTAVARHEAAPKPVNAPQAAQESRTLQTAKAALARRAYGQAQTHAPKPANDDLLGRLSARFESGGKPGAVGYDRVGGTSYGIYQISSRAGTFDGFLRYLDSHAPDIAGRLRAAGPSNTGSTAGPMPSAWKTVAHENPERFAKLQHDFIKDTHFTPALQKISDLSGVDLTGRHQAIAQVLWSTAVQHGATGSARIFSAALDALDAGGGGDFESSLIKEVYARRAGQFGSSTERVQGAVQGRFEKEMKAALNMLGGGGGLDMGA